MDNQDFRKNQSRVLAGIVLLAVGIALFLPKTGFPVPSWLLTWPMLLIVIGLFIGIKHEFRGIIWLAMVIFGGISLFSEIAPKYSLHAYTIPIMLIAIGLSLILRRGRPHNRWRRNWYNDYQNEPKMEQEFQQFPEHPQRTHKVDSTNLNYLDSVAIFGSVRKVIVSKDFKGGESVAAFGGAEIDLRQADINGSVVLDVTQICGGTKLILPSHWEIKSEMVAFFGGIEDKRLLVPGSNNPDKILILKGTSILGGIEIRNF